MIDEVDAALLALLSEDTLPGTDIQVAFDAPTKEWTARRTAPTVNLFLYDIQEDMSLRQEGSAVEYDEDGAVVAEHDAPRYFSLSYLVTAWTSRPQDEHRILSILLAGLVRHDVLPPARLTGTLAGLGLPVSMSIAVPPVRDRGLADIWTAVGGNLKPSLDLVVLAPLAGSRVRAAAAVTDGLRLHASDAYTGADESRRLNLPDVPAEDPAAALGVPRERELPAERRRRGGGSRPVGPRR
ncbi:DUF4255 domain-containing protein [Actinoplanes teichomyceticus]|uniref:Uncharacterized protein DUF4255 n=1 Tax=Actinoplanes teichomyceticus TaxID=1867 RepID=A0A561WLI2_ACTTI|nr:DUF4255 domain-containing protein [Actinoplanes teichomyceticus]TWG24728.1 uncharacterized protein DUF4255 [Actinoplanes teichomyceticus]GIF14607.1 hypothetical protein Ate01nite_46390 [Actinoplanes teichomyceticus]